MGEAQGGKEDSRATVKEGVRWLSTATCGLGSSSESQYVGSGKVLFRGRAPSPADIRNLIGYVQQFDFHLPSLTVQETLDFHAKMRLPLDTSARRIAERVREVIRMLGLQHCASVNVGGDEIKGISGGEKRRLSIGIQLLSNPAICLADEPTTGMDRIAVYGNSRDDNSLWLMLCM